MDPSPAALALAAGTAVAAGVVNAVAGGGTLIVVPALTVAGLPAVDAAITATVAQVPGYASGTAAQRADLAGQGRRLAVLAPAGAAGGLAGALLLAVTSEDLFRFIIPWLLFGASALLAGQAAVRAALDRRRPAAPRLGPAPLAATFAAAVYGGYFGGGLGIVLLAILGLVLDDDLRRLNALKQALSLAVNGAAAGLLALSGRVPWAVAGVVAAGSLAGGAIGGRVAGRVHPEALRRAVVVVGVLAGLVYLVRR